MNVQVKIQIRREESKKQMVAVIFLTLRIEGHAYIFNV